MEAAVAAFRESPVIEDVSIVGEREHGVVYRQTWTDSLPGLFESIREAEGSVLSAIAVETRWSFELRFPDHDAATYFYTRYDDAEFPVTIRRTSSSGSSQGPPRSRLSDKQREALRRGVETGYFEVPRDITTVELATELGISDTALLQRSRRGISNVLEESTCVAPELEHGQRHDD